MHRSRKKKKMKKIREEQNKFRKPFGVKKKVENKNRFNIFK